MRNARAGRRGSDRSSSRCFEMELIEPRLLLTVSIDTAGIDPARETWVVIHGRDESPADMLGVIDGLREFRAPDGKFAQVVALDWSAEALDSNNDFSEEAAIPAVGQEAANILTSAGFGGANPHLNLVGHSWGADVAYEISKDLAGGVDRLVALDPAQDAKAVSLGSAAYDTDAADFRTHSQYSLAFLSSLWGSEDAAGRASDSFIVGYDGVSWGYANAFSPSSLDAKAHSLITGLFATMLRNDWFTAAAGPISPLFAPDQLHSGRAILWQRDHYGVTDVRGLFDAGSPNPFPAGVTISTTSGAFEGEIRSKKTTDGSTDVWSPYSFDYFDSSGTHKTLAEQSPPTAQFSVSGVAPGSVPAAFKKQTLVITGTGFRPSSTLVFNNGTDIPINPADLRVVNSTRIEYDLAVGPKPSNWTVRVVNGAVSSAPVTFAVIPGLPGDANDDGTVDFADLVAVAQNYGKSDRQHKDGDFDGDGDVDFADLVVVAQNYGKSLPAAAAVNAAPVRVAAPLAKKH